MPSTASPPSPTLDNTIETALDALLASALALLPALASWDIRPHEDPAPASTSTNPRVTLATTIGNLTPPENTAGIHEATSEIHLRAVWPAQQPLDLDRASECAASLPGVLTSPALVPQVALFSELYLVGSDKTARDIKGNVWTRTLILNWIAALKP